MPRKKSQMIIIFTISIRVAYALSRYSNLSLMIMKPVNSHHRMTSRTYVSRCRWQSLAKIIWNHKFLTSIFGRLKLNSFTSLWWNSAPPQFFFGLNNQTTVVDLIWIMLREPKQTKQFIYVCLFDNNDDDE